VKEIISISLESPERNFDQTVDVLGTSIRIKKLGVDFNFELIKEIISQYKETADLFTISGFPPSFMLGKKEYTHSQLDLVKDLASPVQVIDGQNIRELYQPWYFHRLLEAQPNFFNSKKVGFFTGCIQSHLFPELIKQNCSLEFADPFFIYGVPKSIKGIKNFNRFLKLNIPLVSKIPLKKFSGRNFNSPFLKKIPTIKSFLNSDIFIVNDSQLEYLTLPNLKGKTIIIDHLSKRAQEKLEKANVEKILATSVGDLLTSDLSQTLLEAIFQILKGEGQQLSAPDIIHYLDKLNLSPEISATNDSSTTGDTFSFIVHPLSQRDLFRHPVLKPLRISKKFQTISERAVCLMDGVHYGDIRGIISKATGKEISGAIYTLFETPNMMMKSDKKSIYKKLLNIGEKSYEQGHKLMGLGAYTKIVGDAGVTVARKSPLPVTTGNSLSAAATLWAASYANKKMGFVKKKNNINQGTVLIIGATGSIGKVCSKLLSQFWKKVVIVAPRAFKLIDLQSEILELSPGSEVEFSTEANEYLSHADLIITTTSAQGRKILDINQIKPGAIVCDVSRPFDISEEETLSRPDVLVIASGEVELPGDNVQMNCDIGLPKNTVYACLAETALLTLEGRFESFSLSRDINYQKVIEIDRLARKHGVKLSAIMGHSGEITDDEIKLCKEHAKARRGTSKDLNELRL